jgi:Protein of unknown function, DUF488
MKEFIKILKDNKITCLWDVRDSNDYKHPYGKERLASTLNEHNIEYIECKEYGVPLNIRTKYKNGKMPDFDRWYRQRTDVKEIKGNTVLLCWELFAVANRMQSWNCHRSILAQMFLETGQVKGITHL